MTHPTARPSRSFHLLTAAALALPGLRAQVADAPNGAMLRYPDVSATHIVFVYADDLWLVPRAGGTATPLASPPGLEVLPRFSPDGAQIAFVGAYDGGRDLYTVATRGGVPHRVTYLPGGETLCNWTTDGKLLFFTNALAGRDRQAQLFLVAANGGMPERLPVPYGAFADVSADGRWLAYTPHTRDNRTWKRYRGGMQTDIWLFDLTTKQGRQAIDWEGTDTAPMWHGGRLYYLSDDGPSHRLNLWQLDPQTLQKRQLTQYADHDVKWPAIGPGPAGKGEIVFQHGAELMLFDIPTAAAHAVPVTIPGARATLRPRAVDAAKFAAGWDLSPTGKRIAVAARGDVWSLPQKDGSARNLTRTSGTAERDPLFSPDGRTIAWLADTTGEYEVYSAPVDGSAEPARLTRDGAMFRRLLRWSPDGQWIAFTDKTGALFLLPAAGGEPRRIARDSWRGDLLATPPSFSPDSRWLAIAEPADDSPVDRIVVYEVATGAAHVVTSGMFADDLPMFDRKGDYLYFVRSGNFAPVYGDLDTTFVYAQSQQLVVVPLRRDVRSPLLPKSDEEEPRAAATIATTPTPAAPDAARPATPAGGDDAKPAAAEPKPVAIDFDDFERRAVLLPTKPGVFFQLAVNDAGALLFTRAGAPGGDAPPSLQVVDVTADKPEEKTVLAGAGGFRLSADGKRVLAFVGDGAQIGDAKAEAKFEPVPTAGMQVAIDPRAEWRELFEDAWRLYRDFFYDPGMHQVDWRAVHDQYAPMVADCASRQDLSYVIREMISELNVGHAYYNGGDVGDPAPEPVGLLGCDYALENGAYRIARILEGAPWDTDARGPLSQPGVDVRAGDYLLAVNGVPVDAAKDPWAAFVQLADRVVTLTVSTAPTRDANARTVVVRTLASERDLRYRAWIEGHRRYVAEQTGGRVGYVYVPSTGVDGQNDLVRQLQGQRHLPALIVDERWNSGGQIPTRFVEMLNRPVTNYWARRDGKDWVWPPDGHNGPMCMLVNGLSGSGGDAFPYYFRQAGLGKLIGMRTWGGLVGLSGYPQLIDGGDVEVPSFAFYERDGTWGIEGNGVEPDILVVDDPTLMVDGGDPQLDRAIAEMQAELAAHPFVQPPRPAYPDRRGMGIEARDK